MTRPDPSRTAPRPAGSGPAGTGPVGYDPAGADPAGSRSRRTARGGTGGFGLRGLALAVVVASLAIGSAAMGLASYSAFARALLTTVDSRLSEVATEIARHIENGLQAGVSLEQQRRLLVVMAEERSQAPELAAIRVVDDRDRILFSTNEAEIGGSAEPADSRVVLPLPGPVQTDRQPPWRQVGEATIVFGLPMTGLFGEPLGTVTVALPTAEVADQRERFALSLALAAAALTAAGGLIAALLLGLLPLPATRRLRALRQRLDALDLAAGQPQPALPPAPEAAGKDRGPALAGELQRFEAWLGLRLGYLAEREAEVRRLDETA